MTQEALRANQGLWDEWTRIHETSAFYDLEDFRQGGIRLQLYEVEEVGDVAGQDLAAPSVPFRHRHALLGAPRGTGHRGRLLGGGRRAGYPAGR